MQKTRLTALAAALFAAAAAQAADVTVYGLIDTGLSFQHINPDNGTDSVNKMQLKGSQLAPNRFGFKGSEDLGNGWKVGFQLEGQFNSDDGALTGNTARLFHRAADLFVSNDTYGTLTMGRSGMLRSGNGSTGLWGAKTGPFSNCGGDFVVGHKYVMPGWFKAVDNTITYKTPKMNGLQLHAQYSGKADAAGVQKDFREFNHESDRLWGLAATYGNGPFNMVAIVDSVMYSQKKSTPKDSVKFSLEADYNFGVAKVYAAGMVFRDTNVSEFQGHNFNGFTTLSNADVYDGYSLELGADIPLMGGTAKVNVGWMDADFSDKAGGDTTRIGVGAGYVYPLSKRTQLYTLAGYIRDDSNIATMDHPSATEVMLGLKHSF